MSSCESSFDLLEPPDKPMRRTPMNAKTIPKVSNRESLSLNKKDAKIAVVKMFELKTTKKIPRGIKLEPAITHKKATDWAEFLR